MSIKRSGGQLAPPPSPIPTAKGSRSAGNETLSQFLDHSLNVPDLSLLEPHLPLHPSRPIPQIIDYPSLQFGDYDTVYRLLRSAREFGVVRIACRSIFIEELRSLLKEAPTIFTALEQVDIGSLENFDKEHNKQIVWVRSGTARMKSTRDFLAKRHRNFCEKMDSVESKLDEIAELLGKIFVENIARVQFGKRIRVKESIFSLYRHESHDQNYSRVHNPFSTNEKNGETCDHTFCLHLPATCSQFFVQSASGPLSFEGGPDTIVVIVGHRIEEWSMGDFKCVHRPVICEPYLQRGLCSFSLELKCLSLNFEPNSNKNHKIIYLRDQILIMLVVAFLYKIFVFLFL